MAFGESLMSCLFSLYFRHRMGMVIARSRCKEEASFTTGFGHGTGMGGGTKL